jgi:hypothetical protein
MHVNEADALKPPVMRHKYVDRTRERYPDAVPC